MPPWRSGRSIQASNSEDMNVPNVRTPRDLLLAALERRHLTGFRSSRELAWVVFPPQDDGAVSLEVIHVPRVNRFRVVSMETNGASTAPATTLGEFKNSDDAAACVEDALNGQAPADAGMPLANGAMRNGVLDGGSMIQPIRYSQL